MVEDVVIVIYYVASFKYHLLGASIIPMVSSSEASVRFLLPLRARCWRWKEEVENARVREREKKVGDATADHQRRSLCTNELR